MAGFHFTCPICKRITIADRRNRHYCSRACQRLGYIKLDGTARYDHNVRHRSIVEKAIGIKLPPKSIIHHVDGNGRNNTHYNLVVCENQAYHILLHYRQRILEAGGDPNKDKICWRCQRVLPLSSFYPPLGQCKVCTKSHRKDRPSGRHLLTN